MIAYDLNCIFRKHTWSYVCLRKSDTILVKLDRSKEKIMIQIVAWIAKKYVQLTGATTQQEKMYKAKLLICK